MKILISGHNRGIGKSIADHFASKHYNIVGFSRSNNKDLAIEGVRTQFILESMSSDVIVLNANIGFDAVQLLYKICQVCKGQQNKTIVILGSQSTETTKTFPHQYQIEKIALESAAQQLQNITGYPTIVVVRPGYVDTDSVRHVTDVAKISPDSVAELIATVLELNQRTDYKILNILFVPK